jgi:glycosyltransferase involved in cell wall biosynthesis
MIKVCYILGTLEVGGAEKQLLKLLKSMDRTRFLPVLIALRGGALRDEFEEVCRVTVTGKRWKIDPAFLVRLIRTIKKEHPDILHTLMFTSNTWGRIAGITAGVPVIIGSERCVDLWKRWYHRLIDRVLLRFTFRVIGNSDAVKNFYQRTEKIHEDKISVVYNGVDLNEFSGIDVSPSLKKEMGIEWARFIIGAGGRFTEQKGFINLLRAVPLILKVYPDSVFVFVGDGPLRGSFEKFVRENGIKRNVVFTGYRKDILRIFALCDIIAVPSLFEGMPNIVLEAMALKKPVVGTDIPEIAELVEDGKNGLLIPVKNNSKVIAEKIITLLQGPGPRRSMGEKGYNTVMEKFSLDKMVKGYEEIYLRAWDEKCARYAE